MTAWSRLKDDTLRVFMCEFVTGGGLRRGDLPPSLAREGAMMRDALARDLLDIVGVDLVTTHDARTASPLGLTSVPVEAGTDVWALWARLAANADVAWVVAPETGGVLARLTALVRASGAAVVGPDDETIRIASSKTLTAERLIARRVPTAPVWRAGEVPAQALGPFVSKPDDGAGCDATRYWAAMLNVADIPTGHIVQPFVEGEAASLTVLRAGGRTALLAANRQHVVVEHGVFAFRGVSVAALDDADGALAALARAAADALPGLAGIFGIDVVLSPQGPVVIEINPRLTTAYAGLRDAIGQNPVTLVPPFAAAGRTAPLARRTVEVAL